MFWKEKININEKLKSYVQVRLISIRKTFFKEDPYPKSNKKQRKLLEEIKNLKWRCNFMNDLHKLNGKQTGF